MTSFALRVILMLRKELNIVIDAIDVLKDLTIIASGSIIVSVIIIISNAIYYNSHL